MNLVARRLVASSTQDALIGFRCSGKKHSGQPCNKLLLEMHPDAIRADKQVRIKCKDCNAVNSFVGIDDAA